MRLPDPELIFRSPVVAVLLAALAAVYSPGALAQDNADNSTSAGEHESPWLLVPSLSVDPKLGTSLGGMGGYIHRFDADSTPSMFIAGASYSNSDSLVVGVIGQMFFDADRQKLMAGVFGGEINNDYDDFLGSGSPAQTTDNLQA